MQKRTRFAIIAAALAFFGLAAWLVQRYHTRPLPSASMPLISNSFIVGINYPWVNYGSDFGDSFWGHSGISTPAAGRIVEQDFAELQSENINVVRWFLWADGHGGIHFNANGSVSGLDSDFFIDMDAAIAIARRHNIRIMFVLVDFKFFEGESYGTNGHNWGAHDLLVTSASARATFLEKAVRPLAERYANEPTIAAWEVVNEPEWEISTSIRWGRKEFTANQMQTFVASVVASLHRYSHQPVTVGSLSPSLLVLWKKVGLDFYEAHSYPYTEFLEPLPASAILQGLDKPCILGEFPLVHGNRPAPAYLEDALNEGYAGAFGWSMHAMDKYSNYPATRDKIKKWHKGH